MIAALDRLEADLVAVVAKVAPWAAPLPTAYLVFARTVEHLGWPWQVALAAAVVVEALGLVITLTGLELYGYNRTRRKADPAAPVTIPVALLVVYLVTAELLTVGLDVVPKWGNLTLVDWIPAVFPILSLAGMAVIAVRIDHRQRLAEIASGKAETRQKRDERRTGGAHPAGETHGPEPERSARQDATPVGGALRCGFEGCGWVVLWPSAKHADERGAKAARSAHMRWCDHRNGHKAPEEVMGHAEMD